MRWKTFFMILSSVAAPLPAQEVTLPLSRYEELRELANPEPEPEPEPPVPVAFETAKLHVAVGASSARITQELTLDLYGEGWQKVPLSELGTYIDSQLRTLEGRLNGSNLLVRGQGRHTVRLVSVVEVATDETATRPTRTLELEAPPAVVVLGELELDDDVDEVEDRGAVLLGESDGAVRGWVAEPGESFGFTLYGAAVVPERSLLPLRFDAVAASRLEVSRTRRRLDTRVSVRVLQGKLETLRVALPDGFEVVGVDGSVAGWDVSEGELEVTAPSTVTDALDLGIRFAGEPAGEFTSPLPEVVGAASLLLATKVEVDGDGFLNLVDAGAGHQPDARQKLRLPSAFRDAAGLALVVPRDSPPPRWEVAWPDSAEVLAAQVDRLLIDAIAGTSGRAAYQLWAEVRSSGAPRLVVALPGAELIGGWRDGVALVPGRSNEGWSVPLASTAEAQVLHLTLLLPLDLDPGGREPIRLPMPTLSAPAARVEARVQLPGGRRYSLADPTRASRVGAPPAIARRAEVPALVRQLSMEAEPAGLSVLDCDLFDEAAGFVILEATWSALSLTPAPLEILARASTARKEWF